MDDKKEGMNRNKITIHSLRRFVYTTICNTVDQGFAEEYLGHSGSVYHTMKESERREIYATKIMKYLTFLDFSGLETVSKNIEIKLEEKDRQIQILKETEAQNTDAITTLSDRVTILTRDMMALKKQNDN